MIFDALQIIIINFVNRVLSLLPAAEASDQTFLSTLVTGLGTLYSWAAMFFTGNNLATALAINIASTLTFIGFLIFKFGLKLFLGQRIE